MEYQLGQGSDEGKGQAEQQRGELQKSERRVGGPHGARGRGGRVPGENGSVEKLPGPALPVPARPEPRPGLPETQSPRGTGGGEGKEGRDTEHEEEGQLAPPSQGEQLMAGTVTTTQTRNARTLDASGPSASAQACKPRPYTPSPRPSTEQSLAEATPLQPGCSTRAHFPLHSLSASHHFPLTQPKGACALLVLPGLLVFPALHWPPEEGQSSHPSLGIPGGECGD